MWAAVNQLNLVVFFSFVALSAVMLVAAVCLRFRSSHEVHSFIIAGCFLALLGAVIGTQGQVSLKDAAGLLHELPKWTATHDPSRH